MNCRSPLCLLSLSFSQGLRPESPDRSGSIELMKTPAEAVTSRDQPSRSCRGRMAVAAIKSCGHTGRDAGFQGDEVLVGCPTTRLRLAARFRRTRTDLQIGLRRVSRAGRIPCRTRGCSQGLVQKLRDQLRLERVIPFAVEGSPVNVEFLHHLSNRCTDRWLTGARG